MGIYAMESTLLRGQKAAATKGQAASETMIDTARIFVNDAAERVEHEAKRAIAAVQEGGMLTTQMAGLKRFAKRAPETTIALRRGGVSPRQCSRKTATRSKGVNSSKGG